MVNENKDVDFNTNIDSLVIDSMLVQDMVNFVKEQLKVAIDCGGNNVYFNFLIKNDYSEKFSDRELIPNFARFICVPDSLIEFLAVQGKAYINSKSRQYYDAKKFLDYLELKPKPAEFYNRKWFRFDDSPPGITSVKDLADEWENMIDLTRDAIQYLGVAMSIINRFTPPTINDEKLQKLQR